MCWKADFVIVGGFKIQSLISAVLSLLTIKNLSISHDNWRLAFNPEAYQTFTPWVGWKVFGLSIIHKKIQINRQKCLKTEK